MDDEAREHARGLVAERAIGEFSRESAAPAAAVPRDERDAAPAKAEGGSPCA